MRPDDRYEWIVEWLKNHRPAGSNGPATRVEITDAAFVAAYIEATGAKHGTTWFGAHKCPQLGRDLSAMAKNYILKRTRVGLEGMAGMGFPTWVWSYRLHPIVYPASEYGY